jgi:steroid delta-isomerase-like uncharacterized protein
MADDPKVTVYQTICTSFNAITDWRAKLLGFLPLASGAGIFYLLNSAATTSTAVRNYFLPIGIVGALVSLGLFFYDLRVIQVKHGLIVAGSSIERDLHIDIGPFTVRPHSFAHTINDVVGSSLIYLSVIAGWAFFGLAFIAPIAAWGVAFGVFLVGGIVVNLWSKRRPEEDVMSESNIALARRWFDEIWNKGRREAIDELMPADCIIHDGDATIVGPEGFKPYFDRLQAAFSDIHVEILDNFAAGDLVCTRWVVTMRHTGDALGMPATGKQLRATGMGIVRIRNGRFAEGWQNWDMLGLMEQIHGANRAAVYMAAS